MIKNQKSSHHKMYKFQVLNILQLYAKYEFVDNIINNIRLT